jgi:heme A synthase
MLKKSLSVQIIILVIEIVIGLILVNKFNTNTKHVHAAIGILVSITAITTVYFAIRDKSSRLITGLAITALVFTLIAYVGGKISTTHYDQGLTIMRSAAFAALAICLYNYYLVQKRSIKQVPPKAEN